MNHFSASHKTQGIRSQNPCLSKPSSGVCLQNSYDYSPFGVSLDGRTVEGDFYRRGFNGMEKDDEVKGKGNSYDFGARINDPRVGRWLSIDPAFQKYPWLSTYQYTSNNPIKYIDIDGRDFGITFDHKNGTILISANFYTINEKTTKEAKAAVANWNSLSGMKVEIEGKQYIVNLELKVISTEKNENGADKQLNFEQAHYLSNNDFIGNTYNGSTNGFATDKTYGKKYSGAINNDNFKDTGIEVGLSDGKNITMPVWMIQTNNSPPLPTYAPTQIENSVEHEMGHNLGIWDHFGIGVMKLSNPNKPNKEDVLKILNNAASKNTGQVKVTVSHLSNNYTPSDEELSKQSKEVKLVE